MAETCGFINVVYKQNSCANLSSVAIIELGQDVKCLLHRQILTRIEEISQRLLNTHYEVS